MSEEILKALMQLFAIIAKQDDGVEENERKFVINFLTHQLNAEAVQEYLGLFDKKAGLNEEEDEGDEEDSDKKKKRKLTSVKDSVRILGLCRKINKTLDQGQKAIVLVRLFELVNTDKKFTEQRMAIINTVAEVFKIPKEEFLTISSFTVEEDPKKFDSPEFLIIDDKGQEYNTCKYIQTEKLDREIYILHIPSVDLYFLKYSGKEDLFLNGLGISNRNIYLFAPGSTVKLPKGKPVYYSDVVSRFLSELTDQKISFNVRNLEFKFPNGNIGLSDINLSEGHGKLCGIMGASGAGKTTLLNVLSGIESPSSGEVLINGVNLHTERKKIEGVIGYIPQDDLLIEELTVFQNLYYNAKLCFKDKTEEEIVKLVDKTLTSLGLIDRKHLKVGSPMKKMISGGQRKRLNIALELIREPAILFVDEPTSGLSSRDSENVMDLLRELALKGKLIFVVIHQPSSEIYKMFDKMVLLDTGGYLVYYGNPVEGVMYFKRIDAQINSDVGECSNCGNVNPELIFNIIEAKVVDEFGNYTEKRKVTPTKWEQIYKSNIVKENIDDILEDPPTNLRIPGWISQFKIYTIRDFLSKVSNTQYVALNLLEAPVLAFILAFIIRYIADPNSSNYIFRENENIPPYIFMSIVVALFLGLTVSAEEIFRDRKILKREAFLNLSRSAYLSSKIVILFALSAVQAMLFVLVGNFILGIHGMWIPYFFALFSISAFANMLGLNISATFNSAITIYILIPLLMIPEMILGGAMFSFDKLNRDIGSVDKVPFIAEFMASKWAYEALVVNQFKNNEYQQISSNDGSLFEIEKKASEADFKVVWYLPKLVSLINDVFEAKMDSSIDLEAKRTELEENLSLVRNELAMEMMRLPEYQFEQLQQLYLDSFNNFIAYNTKDHIKILEKHYNKILNKAITQKELIIEFLNHKDPVAFNNAKNDYFNESVSDIVKKVFEKNKILRFQDKLVQQVDPIYKNPDNSTYFSFRAHFLAPTKHFMGNYYDTFWFNMIIIWLMTVVLYITVYYEHLKKLLNLSDKLKFRK